ncbi:hypothetical protein HY844_00400 [Candidatus Berkelbacteria bacterium]|nr:hypothetical protein [Candidatus Berkelbacteria bacterium]
MIKSFFNFVLIWLVFFSSLGYTLNQLQQPEFLTEQLREAKTYERLSSHTETFLPKENIENLPFNNQDLEDIIKSTIDANTFYDFTDKWLTAYINWFKSDDQFVGFSYNLTQIKEKLVTTATDKALVRYDSLDVCTNKQLTAWDATKGLPECKISSSASDSNTVKPLFKAQIENQIKELPDTFKTGDTPSPLELKIKESVKAANKAILIIWVATFLFIALYFVFFRAHAFMSLSIIFIIAGLLEIGFGLIGWEWLRNSLVDGFKTQQELFAALLVDISASIIEVMKTILGNLSIITLSLGAVSLILGIYFAIKSRSKTLG